MVQRYIAHALSTLESMSTLTQDDLRWLACPVCHHALTLEAGIEAPATPPSIRCTACARIYPIADGLPILLEARALHPERS